MVVLALVVGVLVLFVALPFVLAFLCGVYDGLNALQAFKKYNGKDDKQ